LPPILLKGKIPVTAHSSFLRKQESIRIILPSFLRKQESIWEPCIDRNPDGFLLAQE
jgi:hypothetical protein